MSAPETPQNVTAPAAAEAPVVLEDDDVRTIAVVGGGLAGLTVVHRVFNPGASLAGTQVGVEAAVDHPRVAGVKRHVLATGDGHGLYARFGFESMTEPQNWMIRRGPGA